MLWLMEKFFWSASKKFWKDIDNIWKIAIGQRDVYTTGCVLDYVHFKSYYKMIAKTTNIRCWPESNTENQFYCKSRSRRTNGNVFHYWGTNPPLPPYQLYSNKKFFNRFSQLSFFHFHKIYIYMFWLNLDKCFAEGYEIWPFCGREV